MLLAILSQSDENNHLYETLATRYKSCRRVNTVDSEVIDELMSGMYSTLLVDCSSLSEQPALILEALLGVSNIVPSLYFNFKYFANAGRVLTKPRQSFVCNDSNQTTIFDNIEAILGRNSAKELIFPRSISVFDRGTAVQFLESESALCALLLDASSFQSIEATYGHKASVQAKSFLENLLLDLWGKPGSFRSQDVLCRLENKETTYLILLDANRSPGLLPAPGALERIADRVQMQVENSLWRAMTSHSEGRSLPRGMTLIPDVIVGYASVTSNQLKDQARVIDELVHLAAKSVSVQRSRTTSRRREYMQNIICTDGALRPVYQGVFDLQKITRQDIERLALHGSIAPLKQKIFGFESLIRANQDIILEALGPSSKTSVDPQILSPDVMFNLAKNVDISLELDMAALQLAVKFASDLPGRLMINILPRNFYNLSKMQKFFPKGVNPVFEVSESEAIENFDLVCEVREDLRRMNYGVATDDFGKDYGGLERIFKIQPDIIKLDRALISNIQNDPPRQAFLAGLVNSAKISNALTLAEGVEEWEELETLQKIGCELVQGYLLHRPQAVGQLLQDLESADTNAEDPDEAEVIPLRAQSRAS